MNLALPEVPYDPLALADAIDRQSIYTMIPHARFMPPPMDHEYAVLRYRCAHLNYALTKQSISIMEMLWNVAGVE